MSANNMARTVLATGLADVADKFLDAEQNELPPGSLEADYFIIEAALQRGFEMIDDDGDVYVCSSRQIVALVQPYRQRCEELAPFETAFHHIAANLGCEPELEAIEKQIGMSRRNAKALALLKEMVPVVEAYLGAAASHGMSSMFDDEAGMAEANTDAESAYSELESMLKRARNLMGHSS